jgi:hypothetical protein
MQGGNYSLNQGLNYKSCKTSRVKTQMTISYPKRLYFEGTLFIFFFKAVAIFHSKDQETLQQ